MKAVESISLAAKNQYRDMVKILLEPEVTTPNTADKNGRKVLS